MCIKKENNFLKIINKTVPADIVYQDNLVTAFYDIHPKAPIHIVIVTNQLIPTVNDIKSEQEIALGRLFTVAAKLAKKEKISTDGYRLIVNCNRYGGQEINHLHMHLLGGKYLGNLLS